MLRREQVNASSMHGKEGSHSVVVGLMGGEGSRHPQWVALRWSAVRCKGFRGPASRATS